MNRTLLLFSVAVFSIIGFASFALLSFADEATDEPVAEAIDLAKATFAGGCFWCMEPPFDKTDGVVSTTSGYAGGVEVDPTYNQVASGKTGHAEVVQVVFDPKKVSYEELLHIFWRNVDPLTANRQFCDGGAQYRTAVFAHDDTQLAAALASKKSLEASGRFDAPIVTEIEPIRAFYPAEEYHQDYYKKNPIRYRYYRRGCGRDTRLTALWGEEAGGMLAKK
jgi:peptide-methionine (S)-S-oxide reductase